MFKGRRLVTCLIGAMIPLVYAPGQSVPASQREAPRTNPSALRWQCVAKGQANESLKFFLSLTNDNGKLSGKIQTAQGNFTVTDGALNKESLSVTIKNAEGVNGKLTGSLKDKKLSGEWTLDNDMTGTFECLKVEKSQLNPNGGASR